MKYAKTYSKDLSREQEALVSLLLGSEEIVTMEEIYSVIYPKDKYDLEGRNIVRSTIFRTSKKLEMHHIHNVPGKGYFWKENQ